MIDGRPRVAPTERLESSRWQLVVMAKAPRPGAVKTRLCPPLSQEAAARVATASLLDTMATGALTTASRRVLALDGDAAGWTKLGYDVVPQRGGDLGQRIDAAMAEAWDGAQMPIVLIGMDTPQIGAPIFDLAGRALSTGRVETVLGPALDGGFWVVGTARPIAALCAGVPMSTDRTCQCQRARIDRLGHSCLLLPVFQDVDDIVAAQAVADLAPWSRFATVLVRELDATRTSERAIRHA